MHIFAHRTQALVMSRAGIVNRERTPRWICLRSRAIEICISFDAKPYFDHRQCCDSDVCWGRCFAVVWRYSHSESQALQLQWLNRDGHLLFARTERRLPLRRLKVYTASSDNRESIPAFSPWAFWGLPNQRSNPQKRTAGLQNIFTSPRVPNQRSLSASPLKEGSVDAPWQNG